jgi:hypothetical protein
MRLSRTIPIYLIFVLLLSSCIHSRYFRRVSKNIGEFETLATHLRKDSLQFDCIYLSTADSMSKTLMRKYRLKRICMKHSNHPLSTMISFHRDYNPMLGKADVIYCDFGSSDLRDHLNAEVERKDEKLKRINGSFIYALYPEPMFGF